MKIIVHSDFSTLEPLRAKWNELAIRCPTNSIFQHYDWNKLWWDHYGPGCELCVITVHEQEKLLAVAPLMIHRRRINGLSENILGFIGTVNQLSDYCDFLFDPNRLDALELLLSQIWEISSRWTILDLFNFPSHSPALSQSFKYFGGKTCLIQSRFLYDAPRYVFKNDSTDSEIANKKSLKRHFNRLSKQGVLEFSELSQQDSIKSVDAFFDQHIARRAFSGDKSLFVEQSKRDFFQDLINAPSLGQFSQLAVLSLDKKPIAYHFGFNYAQVFYWYLPCFDPELAEFSPGEVMLKFLLESAITRKLHAFDFTIGSEAFKYRFSNRVERVYNFLVYRRLSSYVLARSRQAASHIKAKIVGFKK
jgi:CelD/BcsL family acetyltransferase involved in cellulose biosynthesis